jgi:hypothetical protein
MFKIFALIFLLTLALNCLSTPGSDLDAALENIRKTRQLMGIQLEVTNRTHTLYHGNFGSKDNSKPITN